MSFIFKRLENPGVVLIQPEVMADDRGFFAEIFKTSDFTRAGICANYCQANHSRSIKNVVRGLHYQAEPMGQAKLVRALSGRIYDVVVDIRKGSPFYGKSLGIQLDSQRLSLLYVPKGFAHGFCVLSDVAEIEYFCSNSYSKDHERGIRYDDPALGICWPVKKPIVSKKDSGLPTFEQAKKNSVYEK